jgi:hypothetical protein
MRIWLKPETGTATFHGNSNADPGIHGLTVKGASETSTKTHQQTAVFGAQGWEAGRGFDHG